jgi:lysozyme
MGISIASVASSRRIAIALLTLSGAGLVGIASQEDYSAKAYIPVPGDVPTVGFGSTEGVRMGDTTTPVRALIRLNKEVEGKYGKAVHACITAPLHQHEYDVFVRLAYNIGPSAFCKSTLVTYANAKEYGKACGQVVRFIYGPGQIPLKGLQNLRSEQYLTCVKEPDPSV